MAKERANQGESEDGLLRFLGYYGKKNQSLRSGSALYANVFYRSLDEEFYDCAPLLYVSCCAVSCAVRVVWRVWCRLRGCGCVCWALTVNRVRSAGVRGKGPAALVSDLDAAHVDDLRAAPKGRIQPGTSTYTHASSVLCLSPPRASPHTHAPHTAQALDTRAYFADSFWMDVEEKLNNVGVNYVGMGKAFKQMPNLYAHATLSLDKALKSPTDDQLGDALFRHIFFNRLPHQSHMTALIAYVRQELAHLDTIPNNLLLHGYLPWGSLPRVDASPLPAAAAPNEV